jgi:Helix-turn-helix domain
MIEKQFGTLYGPALKYGEKAACIISLQAEVDQRGGVPYGWMKIYEALLFGFYNPRTGECFPSHKAIAAKARCSVRSVQRALKWARENNLIVWAHGIVREGWRVLRTSNRYAFSAFLTIPRIPASIASSNRQKERRITTSYKYFTQIAAEAKSFSFLLPLFPSEILRAVGKRKPRFDFPLPR